MDLNMFSVNTVSRPKRMGVPPGDFISLIISNISRPHQIKIIIDNVRGMAPVAQKLI